MGTTYKIGEAAALLNLKTYVLRFWETEFPDIAPLRTEKGQRLYTAGHLALLERIRFLLHERGLTIGGARKILAEEKARGVEYVFGPPGAVEGADAGAAALTGESEALPAAEEAPALSAPGDPDDDPDDDPDGDPEEDGAQGGAFGVCARPRGAGQGLPGAELLPAQYNLPGLEGLPPARPGAEIAAAREGAAEDGLSAEGAAKGMLPLFSVGTAGAARGGGNFIQSGSARDEPGGSGKAPLPGREAGREARKRALLQGIADELDEVAAMLRR